ncbi:hypothetical protein TNCV_3557991 [Trichonephila clavipes]|uniref:Uncharacterized protein n=1 Tax=Trichonephila clavipes TaxID=2585209 RepID=A0A8X6WDX1_TRICX|nr:hypothetical protein TNCV_3557991 [Trichonephila clavipes]
MLKLGGSVMLWGESSWREMGPLIRLDMTLTGDRYVGFLSDHLHPFHFALRRTWGTSAGQCDTSHIQNCSRLAPRALF